MMNITILASGSKGNCYHVDNGQDTLLIEAGLRYSEIQKRLKFHTHELCGCLISHEHQDHSKAIDALMYRGVDCYASAGTWESLKAISYGRYQHTLKTRTPEMIRSYEVIGFNVEHDATEPLGFLIKSTPYMLLYVTDAQYLKYNFQGVTHLMIECNYSLDKLREKTESGEIAQGHKNRVMRSHMSIDTVMEMLNAMNRSLLKEIWLLHLSDDNSDAEDFQRRVQGKTGVITRVA